MTSAPTPATVAARAEALLAGPRGRRMLLLLAIELDERERAAGRDSGNEHALHATVHHASRDLDPEPRSPLVALQASVGDGPVVLPVVTVSDVAEHLRGVPTRQLGPDLLMPCLSDAVDLARYWQQPEGDDVLAAYPEIVEELRRFARAVAGSPHADWWFTPLDAGAQWAVQHEGLPFVPPMEADRAALAEARQLRRAREQRVLEERPADPTANRSGEWWSRPPFAAPATTRATADGSPVKLWCTEDSFGWEELEAQRLGVPAGVRVFEIDSADAWAELCARFPFDTTGEVRHDWFRTTGRDGTWLVPDWGEVAREYDAVHLQVGAYLAAAGTAIPVPLEPAAGGGHRESPVSGSTAAASVIAGWDADETFWFSDRVRYLDSPVTWIADDTGGTRTWRVRA